jgi:hypothetical protein
VAFVTDTDVKAKYARIGAAWSAIAAAASNASDKLTDGQKSTMSLLASRFQTMQQDAPSFFRAAAQSDTADALERDVWAFADDLKSSGVPGLPSKPSATPATAFDKLLDLAPMLLIALAVLAVSKGSRS